MSLSEKKVVNELLTYLQYHLTQSMNKDELIENCAKKFTYGDISCALKLLLESLEIEDRMSYQQMFKEEEILLEIIKLLQQIERSEVPTFVAKDLHKLPPVNLVVKDLIKDFTKLQNTLAGAQEILKSVQFQINTCNQKLYRCFEKSSDELLSQNVTYSTEVGAAIITAPLYQSAQCRSADQEMTSSVSPHVMYMDSEEDRLLTQKRKSVPLNSAARTEVNRQSSSGTNNANPQMVYIPHTGSDNDIILPVPFIQERTEPGLSTVTTEERTAPQARKINLERRVTFDDSVKTVTIEYQKDTHLPTFPRGNNPTVAKERKKRRYRSKTTDERNRSAIEYTYSKDGYPFCIPCNRRFSNKGGFSSHYLAHEREKKMLVNQAHEPKRQFITNRQLKGSKPEYDPQLNRNTQQAGTSHSNSRPISQDSDQRAAASDLGECIPVLKPVPGCKLPQEHPHVASPPLVISISDSD